MHDFTYKVFNMQQHPQNQLDMLQVNIDSKPRGLCTPSSTHLRFNDCAVMLFKCCITAGGKRIQGGKKMHLITNIAHSWKKTPIIKSLCCLCFLSSGDKEAAGTLYTQFMCESALS